MRGDSMNIIQSLVSPSKYSVKCPYPMEAEYSSTQHSK